MGRNIVPDIPHNMQSPSQRTDQHGTMTHATVDTQDCRKRYLQKEQLCKTDKERPEHDRVKSRNWNLLQEDESFFAFLLFLRTYPRDTTGPTAHDFDFLHVFVV